MNNKEKMYKEIAQHGANLNAIFNTGIDDVKLSKKLFSLERKAHKLAVDYCNGENGVNSENWGEKCEPILKEVRKVLNCTDNFPIFLNGDARGYALKIDDKYMQMLRERNNKVLHTDWGGYGILAPDFN